MPECLSLMTKRLSSRPEELLPASPRSWLAHAAIPVQQANVGSQRRWPSHHATPRLPRKRPRASDVWLIGIPHPACKLGCTPLADRVIRAASEASLEDPEEISVGPCTINHAHPIASQFIAN